MYIHSQRLSKTLYEALVLSRPLPTLFSRAFGFVIPKGSSGTLLEGLPKSAQKKTNFPPTAYYDFRLLYPGTFVAIVLISFFFPLGFRCTSPNVVFST